MRSLGYGNPGNINLRGKKSKRLRCGCCTMHNHRDREEARLAQREADHARAHFGQRTDEDYEFGYCRYCSDTGFGCSGYCLDLDMAA